LICVLGFITVIFLLLYICFFFFCLLCIDWEFFVWKLYSSCVYSFLLFFFFFQFIFNWGKLLYSIVFVSTIKHESVITVCVCVCVFLPSWASLQLPPSPSCPFRSSQSARLGSLCYIATSHQISVLYMIMYICRCYFLHLSHSLPPLLGPLVHSLYLSLHSFPANRFISTILDSIYMC